MAISDHFLRKVQINTHDFVLTSVIRDYLDEKIKKLKAFSSNKKEAFPLVSYIDLRFKNRVIVMPIKRADKNKGDIL